MDIGSNHKPIASARRRLSAPTAPILQEDPRGHLKLNLDTSVMQVHGEGELLAVCFGAHDDVPARVPTCALEVLETLTEIGVLISERKGTSLMGPLAGLCECKTPYIPVSFIPMSMPEREEVSIDGIKRPFSGDNNVCLSNILDLLNPVGPDLLDNHDHRDSPAIIVPHEGVLGGPHAMILHPCQLGPAQAVMGNKEKP